MKNVPKNLEALKRKVLRYTILKSSLKKENYLFLRMNKSYRNFNLKKRFSLVKEAREMLSGDLFHSYDWLLKNKRLKKTDEGVSNDSLYSELFKREVAVQIDRHLWKRNDKCRTQHRMKYKRSKTSVYLKVDGKKHSLGKIPSQISKQRVERIKNFLLANKVIFNKKSKYFLKDTKIRQLVRELQFSNIEEYDLQEFISKVKSLKRDLSSYLQ